MVDDKLYILKYQTGGKNLEMVGFVLVLYTIFFIPFLGPRLLYRRWETSFLASSDFSQLKYLDAV